jgi:hypothetical protein
MKKRESKREWRRERKWKLGKLKDKPIWYGKVIDQWKREGSRERTGEREKRRRDRWRTKKSENKRERKKWNEMIAVPRENREVNKGQLTKQVTYNMMKLPSLLHICLNIKSQYHIKIIIKPYKPNIGGCVVKEKV